MSHVTGASGDIFEILTESSFPHTLTFFSSRKTMRTPRVVLTKHLMRLIFSNLDTSMMLYITRGLALVVIDCAEAKNHFFSISH